MQKTQEQTSSRSAEKLYKFFMVYNSYCTLLRKYTVVVNTWRILPSVKV